MNNKILETISNSRTFLMENEDMCLHIIKTGHSKHKNYIVVKEDAYDQSTGECQMMSSSDIYNTYQIKL